MNHVRAFFEWPRQPGNFYVPWPLIAWRMLWMPFIVVGKLILCFGVLFAFGPFEATRVWEQV